LAVGLIGAVPGDWIFPPWPASLRGHERKGLTEEHFASSEVPYDHPEGAERI